MSSSVIPFPRKPQAADIDRRALSLTAAFNLGDRVAKEYATLIAADVPNLGAERQRLREHLLDILAARRGTDLKDGLVEGDYDASVMAAAIRGLGAVAKDIMEPTQATEAVHA